MTTPTFEALAARLDTFAAQCCIPDDEETPPRQAAELLRAIAASAEPVAWRDFLKNLIERCEHGDINAECDDLDWRDIYVKAQAMLAASPTPEPREAQEVDATVERLMKLVEDVESTYAGPALQPEHSQAEHALRKALRAALAVRQQP